MSSSKRLPLTLDPARTAVLAIDPQNSFLHPDGLIARNGGDVSMMTAALPYLREVVVAGREQGIQDIWTQHVHYPNDAKWGRHQVLPHSYRWDAGPTALKGTWEAEFFHEVQDLTETSTEVVVKHRFSSFLDTRLDTLLRMLDVRTLIVTGYATTHCIECTVRDAYQRDYDVIVPSEAVAAISKSGHDASLEIIDKVFGKVLPTADVLRLVAGETLEIDYASGWTER
ncbi:cysteine hydrolase family protein [Pimelobacter simplex]|uniref:cysteine hydrolase family protein n=1 Tax=Nocardioides simplex TaxID=2045 RepID=UPI003AAA5340